MPDLRLDKLSAKVIYATSNFPERQRLSYNEGRAQKYPFQSILERELDSLRKFSKKIDYGVQRNKSVACEIHHEISRLRSEHLGEQSAEKLIIVYTE